MRRAFFRTFVGFIFIASISKAQMSSIVLLNESEKWDNMSFSYWTSSSNWAIGYQSIKASGLIDESKNSVVIATEEPMFINFSWNFKIQIVCLFPGDTLKFRITSNDETPFQFTGTRPHEELMFHSLLETSNQGYLTNNNQIEISGNLNFQFIADQTRQRYNERLRLLELNDCSHRGRELLKKALYYRYLSDLLFPYQASKPIEEIAKSSKYVPAFYKAILEQFHDELANDSLMYILDYKRFIRTYAKFMMIEKSGIENPDLIKLIEFYKRTFNGRKRDLLLNDEVISSYHRTGDVSLISEVIDSISDYVMRDTLMSIQMKATREFSEVAKATEIESASGDRLFLEEIIQGHKGSIIYLDLWATWCAPCLMEMPDSKQLAKEFERENVKIIYLSIDTDKQKWLRKVEAFNLAEKAQHYWITLGDEFIRKEGIPSIPRYILLSKSGTTISFNAPRPGSREIRNLISLNLQ